MTVQEAHDKAVEAGYFPDKSYCEYRVLIDRQFWKSLGVALGWKERCLTRHNDSIAERELMPKEVPEWRWKWYRFIDHLAEGKSVDSFFEEIK